MVVAALLTGGTRRVTTSQSLRLDIATGALVSRWIEASTSTALSTGRTHTIVPCPVLVLDTALSARCVALTKIIRHLLTALLCHTATNIAAPYATNTNDTTGTVVLIGVEALALTALIATSAETVAISSVQIGHAAVSVRIVAPVVATDQVPRTALVSTSTVQIAAPDSERVAGQ